MFNTIVFQEEARIVFEEFEIDYNNEGDVGTIFHLFGSNPSRPGLLPPLAF